MVTTVLFAATTLLPAHAHRAPDAAIPAFSRRYRVGCTRCHAAAPKLNVVGEAFRMNGYRFPVSEPAGREEPAVPLGEEPWKDLWPRSIWPGDIPGSVPLALRIQTDIEAVRDGDGKTAVNFRMPHEVYLLGGGSLGDQIGVFFESDWSRESGFEVVQAKVKFQRVLPGLGDRAVNLWVGLQSLYLFTFAERQTDRAGRTIFVWQRFRSSEVPLAGAPRPVSAFRPIAPQSAIEINGLITPRVAYGLGLSQGAGSATTDNNRYKDQYAKLRLKLGGMRLDGSYPDEGGPVKGSYGQYLDRALIVEAFAYQGSEPDPTEAESRHRLAGAAARLLQGPLDLGVGYVRGRDDNPWGPGRGHLDHSSLFVKGEYLLYPWLIASVKAEQFTLSRPTGAGGPATTFRQDHVMPGLIALVRQNVRLVAEADLYTRYQSPTARPTPRGFWLRLDLAF